MVIRLGLSVFTSVVLFFTASSSLAVLPSRTMPGGVAVQLKDGDGTEVGFDRVQEGGFSMVRKGIYWNKVEKTKGVYDFTYYDGVMNRAFQRGVWVSITLFGNNALYESGGTGPGIVTAAGRQGFANFAKAAVTHYKGKNVVFEIWNEPNLTSFWHTPSNSTTIADEYVALVKVTAPAMKAADPTATIFAGSISSLWSASFAWFDRSIQQGLLMTGITGVSVHPYGFNWPELIVRDNSYQTIRNKMNAAGGSNLTITNTEVGFPTGWIMSRQGYSEAEAPEVQGWMLVRQQLVDVMAGLNYSNWYEFRDSASWGVVNDDFTPRPSLAAVKTMTRQLAGFTFVSRQATASPLDFVLVFQTSTGKKKLVAWTTGDMADPTGNRKPKPHDVVVSVEGSGTVPVVGTYGATETETASAGKVAISLTGAPKFYDLSLLTTATPTPTPTPAPTATPTPTPTPSSTTNVALKKLVKVSSGAASAPKLVDGITTGTSSRWMSSSGYPQWIEVDLGGSFVVSEVRYWQYSQRTTDYQVEVFDGSVWKKVTSVVGNTSLVIKKTFTPASASKIRFTITKGSYYQKGNELEVIGGRSP